MRNFNLLIVGLGAMGEALVRGLLRAGVLKEEQIFGNDLLQERTEKLSEAGIRISGKEALKECKVAIIAVKPGEVKGAVEEMRPFLNSQKQVISIAAGVSLGSLEGWAGEGIPVVRAMPNLPALIGEGISALARGRWAGKEHIQRAKMLLGAVGEVVEVEEKDLAAITALSASGPAYVFTFIETLSDAGVLLGLKRPLAKKLALQTTLGAARMAKESPKELSQLREMVTSPGGTTIHALEALEKEGFRIAIMAAVRAAAKRAEEIAKDDR